MEKTTLITAAAIASAMKRMNAFMVHLEYRMENHENGSDQIDADLKIHWFLALIIHQRKVVAMNQPNDKRHNDIAKRIEAQSAPLVSGLTKMSSRKRY
jgi:hypothetical protein